LFTSKYIRYDDDFDGSYGMYLLLLAYICENIGTQTAAYTAFDKHNHVDVGKQFEIDARIL